MTKAKKLNVSAKHSNTALTSSHETATQINPIHSQMLSLASTLRNLAISCYDIAVDEEQRKCMFDVEAATGNIICHLGKAVGLDVAERWFNAEN